MSSVDLMGGYAAYTTPNAALRDLATAGAVAEEKQSVTLSIVITFSIWTVTVATQE